MKSADGKRRKTNREIIAPSVFAVVSVLYLGERLHGNHLAGCIRLVGAVFFMFRG